MCSRWLTSLRKTVYCNPSKIVCYNRIHKHTTERPNMARGKYERTELTTARMRLTRTETRLQKLRGQLAEAEHQKKVLEYEIEELEKAEGK